MKNDRFENEINAAVKEAQSYLKKMAFEQAHGDIVVTVTMFRGQPVKITKSFCEHLAKRQTVSLVEK